MQKLKIVVLLVTNFLTIIFIEFKLNTINIHVLSLLET